MTVENAPRVGLLVSTLPEDSDILSEGAAHLRGLKIAVQGSLPVEGDGLSQSDAVGSFVKLESASGRIRMTAETEENTAKLLRDQRLLATASASIESVGGSQTFTTSTVVQDDMQGRTGAFTNFAIEKAVTGAAGARCLVMRLGFRTEAGSLDAEEELGLPYINIELGASPGANTYFNGILPIPTDEYTTPMGNKNFVFEARIFSLAASAPLYWQVTFINCSATLGNIWFEQVLER